MDAATCLTNGISLGSMKNAISLTNTLVCALLLIATLLTNLLVLVAFKRRRTLLQKSMFYKLLLNITIADTLTAIVADVQSISFLMKQYFGHHGPDWEKRLVNYNLYMLNSVSILTMAALCIERLILLVMPVLFQKGFSKKQSVLLLLVLWLTAGLSSVPYLFMGTIEYLTLFTSTNVGLTFVCLVSLTIVYKRYLTLNRLSSVDSNAMSRSHCNDTENWSTSKRGAHLYRSNTQIQDYMGIQNTCHDIESLRDFSASIVKGMRKTHSGILGQRRVNKTFLTMLIVYLATYLPLTIVTVYMNLCGKCNCTMIRILSDCTCIAILLSALLRPLNFIFRLRTIKEEVTAIFESFIKIRSKERRGESVSTEYSSNTGLAIIARQTCTSSSI